VSVSATSQAFSVADHRSASFEALSFYGYADHRVLHSFPTRRSSDLEDSEAALAWALREAVTNVVRHSGAGRCTVELLRRRTVDGDPGLELSVEDNGSGGAGPHGNGLTGLAERLHRAGGTLEAGPTGHGFR